MNLVNLIMALAGLSLIILIHEVGHFAAARFFRIRVLEFSIFMGPKLFSFQGRKTTYSLRLIPFGGYVRMAGEEETSEEADAFCQKPVWQRMIVTVSGAAFNILFALLVFTLTYAASGTYTRTVASVTPGSSAETAGILPGDRLVSYNGKRFYAYPDFDLLTYMDTDPEVAITVRRPSEQGTKSFILVPKRIRHIMGVLMASREGEDYNLIHEIPDPESPAAKAGLMAGDRILSVNGEPLIRYEDLTFLLGSAGGEEVPVQVSREGVTQTFSLTPAQERQSEYTASGLILEDIKTWNPLPNLKAATAMCLSLVRSTYLQLAWLVTGKVPAKELRGPIGIVNVIGDVVGEVRPYGLLIILVSFMQLMALISINIGVLQILPIPALDGGRLLTQLVEVVRRKAIPPEKEAMITYIGFVLFILFFILVSINDIKRWIG